MNIENFRTVFNRVDHQNQEEPWCCCWRHSLLVRELEMTELAKRYVATQPGLRCGCTYEGPDYFVAAATGELFGKVVVGGEGEKFA